MNWMLLANSLLVGMATALFAVALGALVAVPSLAMPRRMRSILVILGIVVLAFPSFMLSNCWLSLLGTTGPIRSWFPLPIYSLPGVIWLLGLWYWPIAFILILNAWSQIPAGLLESETQLRGIPLFRHLLWPAGRSAFGLSLALIFVLASNHFAIPTLLQVKVLPAEMWLQFNTLFDYSGVLKAAWPLVAISLLFLFWLRRKPLVWLRRHPAASPPLWRSRLGRRTSSLTAGIAGCILFLSAILPLGHLVLSNHTWSEFLPTLASNRNAILDSAWLSATAATVIMGLALITHRLRLRLALWLVFLLPGVLLSVGMIYAFNRPATQFIYQTVAILLLAWVVHYLAVGYQCAQLGIAAVDPRLVEATRLETSSKWALFRHAQHPYTTPFFAAGWYITFLLCLWNTESVVLLSPPGVQTVSARIFGLLHYGHHPQVNALCLSLLLVAIIPALVLLLGGHSWIRMSRRYLSRRTQPWRSSSILSLGLAWIVILSGAGCSRGSNPDALPASQIFASVEIIGTRGTGLGQFNKPRSLVLDKEDFLYVVDMTGRVQRFDPAGQYTSYWQMPDTDKGKPKGMGLDAEGQIIVLEPHYSRVNHFATNGTLLQQWGDSGTNQGRFTLPRAVALAPNGDLYISEYSGADRIQKFAANNHALIWARGAFGQAPGQFSRPEGLAVSPVGELYVADSCNHRIQVFSPEGDLQRVFGEPGDGPGELSYPYDLAFGPEGRLFVCEFGNSRIQVFTPQGESIEIIGDAGAAPGRFSNPWSVDFDAAGNLFVADSINHRVQKLLRRKPLTARATDKADRPPSR